MDKQMPKPEDEFSEDLNPQHLAGRNYGEQGPDTTEGVPASEIKDLHGQLHNLSNSELAELPVVEQGTRLEQGKTYLDLNDLERGEFKAMGSQSAEAHNRYVAKDAVGYDLWNKLRGREELTS